MPEIVKIVIDPEATYTKAEYARAYGLHRMAVDQQIRDKKIKTLKIKGSMLILAERG